MDARWPAEESSGKADGGGVSVAAGSTWPSWIQGMWEKRGEAMVVGGAVGDRE